MSLRQLSLLISVAVIAACGDSSARISLSARAGSAVKALTLTGGVTVSRVRLVVKQIKLEPIESDGGGDDMEIAAGPFLVDLKDAELDGGINKVFDVAAKAGQYKELKFKIHKVEDTDTTGNTALAEMKGLSVRVEGTFNGAGFTFDSSLDEELEREGKFVLGEGANNIALNIDPANWFVDGTSTLNPADSANKSKIESNIKASIDAFDDDDHDGDKD